MELDRQLQLAVLQKLAEAYPEEIDISSLEMDAEAISGTLRYLAEHELIEITVSRTSMDTVILDARITARGLDFLADDGGLSAILGVVTVKLHADTIRDLIEARITASPLPEAEKKSLITHVKALPAEALKELTKRLVGLALEATPDAIQQLRIWLDSLRS